MATTLPAIGPSISDTSIPIFSRPERKNKTRTLRGVNNIISAKDYNKNSLIVTDFDEGTETKIGPSGKSVYIKKLTTKKPLTPLTPLTPLGARQTSTYDDIQQTTLPPLTKPPIFAPTAPIFTPAPPIFDNRPTSKIQRRPSISSFKELGGRIKRTQKKRRNSKRNKKTLRGKKSKK
jgi:hypothetical protein